MRTRQLILTLPLLAMTALPVAAQTADAAASDDVQAQLRAMQEELDRFRAQNDTMRSEIDALRASTSDNWMTEQRSEEIRGLVYEVLADADVRSSLLQDGMTAGWNDGFFLASNDGRFLLNLSGQMQIRWIYNYHDQADRHRHGFENTRTKLAFGGHIFSPDIEYFVRTDVTRNEPGLVTGLFFLQDAWVRFRFDNNWALRVGQYKVPFGREELVSSQYQLTVERSLINESFNLGRSQGVEAQWAGDTDRAFFMISDGASDSLGGFGNLGGDPTTINTNALLEDVEYAFHGRYEHLFAGSWDQFVDFTSPTGEPFALLAGIAGHYQKDEANGAFSFTANEKEWWAWTADISAEFGGANVFASFTHHNLNNPSFEMDMYGVVVQAGVYITPKVELFGRYEHAWIDTDAVSTQDLDVMTVGVNYYLDGHDLKWTTDLGWNFNEIDQFWDSDIAGWRVDGADAKPQVVFRTQLQLLF